LLDVFAAQINKLRLSSKKHHLKYNYPSLFAIFSISNQQYAFYNSGKGEWEQRLWDFHLNFQRISVGTSQRIQGRLTNPKYCIWLWRVILGIAQRISVRSNGSSFDPHLTMRSTSKSVEDICQSSSIMSIKW